MAESLKQKGVWGRISAPQVVSERTLRKFHFFPFSILRLAQDVKVQGFNYRSLSLQKFLWFPKNVRIPKYSYLQALLVKHAIDTW